MPHAGSVDRTFGKGGRVQLALPGERMRPRAVTVDPEGRIVVARQLTDSATEYPGIVFGRALVVRFLADGELDRAFGDGGVARVRLPRPVAIQGLAIDAEGALLLSGIALGDPGENLAAVVRLLPDGSADQSFGNGGLVTVEAESFYPYGRYVMSMQHRDRNEPAKALRSDARPRAPGAR